MIEIYPTVNSVYEIDPTVKQVRRTSGENPPTGHFAPDGEWHDYEALHQLVNGGLVVYWPDGTCSVTSMSKEKYDRL